MELMLTLADNFVICACKFLVRVTIIAQAFNKFANGSMFLV